MQPHYPEFFQENYLLQHHFVSSFYKYVQVHIHTHKRDPFLCVCINNYSLSVVITVTVLILGQCYVYQHELFYCVRSHFLTFKRHVTFIREQKAVNGSSLSHLSTLDSLLSYIQCTVIYRGYCTLEYCVVHGTFLGFHLKQIADCSVHSVQRRYEVHILFSFHSYTNSEFFKPSHCIE
jgi:hypothetical protein